jgi:hypothetical protein
MAQELPDDALAAFRMAREASRRGKIASNKLALFSPATLARLNKPEDEYPSDSFSAKVRERLIWASASERGIYEGIESLMGSTANARRIISDNFLGDYALFRFTKKRAHWDEKPGTDQSDLIKSGSMELEFVEDKLSIFVDDMGEPAFAYRSYEWDAYEAELHHEDGRSESDPEIAGAAFYTIGKLFLTGVAQDSMSMAIFQVPTMTRSFYHGFWTSTMLTNLRPPFSARSLLVPTSNAALIERLRSDKGRKEFFGLTQGAYAFYMTLE